MKDCTDRAELQVTELDCGSEFRSDMMEAKMISILIYEQMVEWGVPSLCPHSQVLVCLPPNEVRLSSFPQ